MCSLGRTKVSTCISTHLSESQHMAWQAFSAQAHSWRTSQAKSCHSVQIRVHPCTVGLSAPDPRRRPCRRLVTKRFSRQWWGHGWGHPDDGISPRDGLRSSPPGLPDALHVDVGAQGPPDHRPAHCRGRTCHWRQHVKAACPQQRQGPAVKGGGCRLFAWSGPLVLPQRRTHDASCCWRHSSLPMRHAYVYGA